MLRESRRRVNAELVNGHLSDLFVRKGLRYRAAILDTAQRKLLKMDWLQPAYSLAL